MRFFVYATCITGIIGDDIDSVCKRASAATGLPVLSVHSEGFKGTKKDGYKAACDALSRIVGTGDISSVSPRKHKYFWENSIWPEKPG